MAEVKGSLAQRAFAGGELTPAMWARIDQEKYQHGLKTARNGFIMRQGGFENRPGTNMIAPQLAGTNKIRLIPFVFSNSVSYVLEFGGDGAGNGYVRPFRAGEPVMSGGNPYYFASPYDWTDLPNIQYVQSENVLYMACFGHDVMNLTCNSDTDWFFEPLETTPSVPQPVIYSEMFEYNDAFGVTQYPVYGNLNNIPPQPAVTSWFTPSMLATPAADFTAIEDYAITSVDQSTGIESLPMPGSIGRIRIDIPYDSGYPSMYHNVANSATITSVTSSYPMVVTLATPSFTEPGTEFFRSGDLFTFAGTGVSDLDGKTVPGEVVGNTVIFSDIDSTDFVFTLSGSSKLNCLISRYTGLVHQKTFDDPHFSGQTYTPKLFTVGPLTIYWQLPTVPGDYLFNVYKKSTTGLWGFMTSVSQPLVGNPSFVDDGVILPDTSKGLPEYVVSFIGKQGKPSVIGVYQQRLCLANTPSKQENFFASNTGNFSGFTVHTPGTDSDAIEFQVAGKKYNPITQIIDNGFLLIFTESGEFSCYGDSSGALTPTGINLRQQAFYGSTKYLTPITVGKNVLYMQTRQSKVRELLYNYYINGYSGSDMTVFSNHLFDGHTFTDWCYQQEPNSIVWMVRDDGVLLSLTYLPEQQLTAWTRHDTLGKFEGICSIPEGTEDALYCVVNRNGIRYIERFASRQIPFVSVPRYISDGENAGLIVNQSVPDPNEFVFTDCSSSYDGRQPTQYMMNFNSGDPHADGAGFILSHGTNLAGWDYFTMGMVGSTVILYNPQDGSPVRCKILQYISAQDALARPDVDLPTNMQEQWVISSWAMGARTVSGLDYLNGQKVSVLADGAVVSSPATETMLTVSGGSVTLDNSYAVIRVGLPYTTDMRALDIDTPQQGQTAQDRPQIVQRVSLYVKDTRGLWAGPNPPSDDAVDPMEGLIAYKPRSIESLGAVPDCATGVIIEAVPATWQYGGGIFVRQLDPLPMTVLSLVPAGLYSLGG